MKYSIEGNEAVLWGNNEAVVTLLPIVEFINDGKTAVFDHKNKVRVSVFLPVEIVEEQNEGAAKEIIVNKLIEEGYTEIIIQGNWGIDL